MKNEWDRDSNVITEEDRQKLLQEQRIEREQYYRLLAAQASEAAENRRRSRGYFEPPALDNDALRSNFPYLNRLIDNWIDPNNESAIQARWLANKLVYICHSCGCFGYKQNGEITELFKCYFCRSRDLSVIRTGEISLLLRGTRHGLNMQEVYNARRERIRQERASRSSRRRNS